MACFGALIGFILTFVLFRNNCKDIHKYYDLLNSMYIFLQVVFVLTRQTEHGFVTDSTLWR